MKLRKVFGLIFLFVFSTLSLAAQDKEGMSQKGIEAFEQGDYSTAAYWLKLTKEQAGNFENARTQYMLVRSLYEIRDFLGTRIEASAFFNLSTSKSSAAYKDVQRILNELPNQLEQDDIVFEKATETTNIALLEAYLTNYPNGKHREEAIAIIDDYNFDNARESTSALKKYLQEYPNGRHFREASALIDDKTYENALNKNTPQALANYLQGFPTGRHSGEATITLNGWEQAAYEQVKRTDTDSAYYYYLQSFPSGGHYSEIRDLLETGKEARYFKEVKRSTKPEKYREYLNKYPEGKYAEEARDYLKNTWIQLADQAFDLENFSQAKRYYNDYLADFPLGDERDYAVQQLNRIDKKLKTNAKRNGRLNRFFVAYHFDTAAYLGISMGALSQRRPAFYFAARTNADIFKTYRYEFDNTGANDLTRNYDESDFTGRTVQQRAIATLGFTQKIVRPVWIFGGGGAQYTQTLFEVEEREDGRVFGKEYAINTDADFLTWVVEGGVIVDLWGLHLRAGLTGVEAKKWHPAFSIGFSFGYR